MFMKFLRDMFLEDIFRPFTDSDICKVYLLSEVCNNVESSIPLSSKSTFIFLSNEVVKPLSSLSFPGVIN